MQHAGEKRKRDGVATTAVSVVPTAATTDGTDVAAAAVTSGPRLMLGNVLGAIRWWRPTQSFQPNLAGRQLGALLFESPHLVEALARRNKCLEKEPLDTDPFQTLAKATKRVFGLGRQLITHDEYLSLCKELTSYVPAYHLRNGLPADLCFQLLMHCNLCVVPKRHFSTLELRDASTWVLPPNAIVGKGSTAFCAVNSADAHYYWWVYQTIGRVVERDARRLFPAAIEQAWSYSMSQLAAQMDCLPKDLAILVGLYFFNVDTYQPPRRTSNAIPPNEALAAAAVVSAAKKRRRDIIVVTDSDDE